MEAAVKIHDDKGISRGVPQNPQAVPTGRVESGAQGAQARRTSHDRVEFSDRARALLVASDALDILPQIRVDKVDQLKQLVKSGTYWVPGEKVADRILGEGLFG
jgi:flagellar biosynthesis anti-sigma factor FlgM